ncbi:hypothetical protein BABINDRAFT_33767 [Babjeviella inositovora NRRL Y-12698]|uniref:Exocyst complex component Sec10-like alpha-helical bundle domain-containing protein n=1 Tax=Babjeviella inositovora NRRL Y-12698 TaxID=984486 RepID=A0A1E3QUF1_9ASCO|nr:uncharacterized protein BABINDRAFT_33767 [Babjeviella inositovora NRRL Y-12698]ODQ81309.1 hypothetical protein BABINDRAFT_33767 [Babjeviella inositovora NRRL Y-12698]
MISPLTIPPEHIPKAELSLSRITEAEASLGHSSKIKTSLRLPLTVATNILRFLSFTDAITFGQVNRLCHTLYNSPQFWVARYKSIGKWDEEAYQKRPKPSSLPPADPLTCYDCLQYADSQLKPQLLAIHHCLAPYYVDLAGSNSLGNFNDVKIFQDYKQPQDQARLLVNLQQYTKLVRSCSNSDETSSARLESILEIFQNAILRELEINYEKLARSVTPEQLLEVKLFANILIDIGSENTLVDFFLQRSLNDNEPIFGNVSDYFTENESEDAKAGPNDGKAVLINKEALHAMFATLADVFNVQAAQVDVIFPQKLPIMYKLSEEMVSKHFIEFIALVIARAKITPVYAEFVPFVYHCLVYDFVGALGPSANMGDNKAQMLMLVDLYYEPFVVEYINDSFETFLQDNSATLQKWDLQRLEREQKTETHILAQVVDPSNKRSDKLDLLSSFKKIVIFNGPKKQAKQDEVPKEELTAFDAKIKILNEKLKSLNEIVSLELSMGIINASRILINHMNTFQNIVKLKPFINDTISKIYLELLRSIGFHHIGSSFTKAIALLNSYDPTKLFLGARTEINKISTVEPLVIFTELVNLADLIQQTLHIFYQENLVHSKIINPNQDFLNPIVGTKKKFETSLDSYVANGLNVGIDVLVHEIQFVFESLQTVTDYHPPNFGPTACALKNVEILKNHVNLLQGSTDKAIIDVFQQEIGERFFAAIVKNMKHRCVISTDGAITLIADLNYYYDFILSLRQKPLVPLFTALKNVGSMFLIDGTDAKTLGKMCSDLGKFNGVFTQEDIYEFVQRRSDWAVIKRHVEKVMYGLTLGECCIV